MLETMLHVNVINKDMNVVFDELFAILSDNQVSRFHNTMHFLKRNGPIFQILECHS